MEIDIKIDNITNCLINRFDGKEYNTEYRVANITEDKAKNLKNKGWSFDWSIPLKNGYIVYELHLKGDVEMSKFEC